MSTRRARGTRGSVALVIVVLVPALVVAAGMVLDGGRQLEARRDANGVAQAASRAAVQLTAAELYAQQLDTSLASSRAQAVLASRGYGGSVEFEGAGSVTVTVSASVDFLILPGGATVSGSASADAEMGVNGGSP